MLQFSDLHRVVINTLIERSLLNLLCEAGSYMQDLIFQKGFPLRSGYISTHFKEPDYCLFINALQHKC